MKKFILCSITILCSGLLLAAATSSANEEDVYTLKAYITLLDKKNTQKLLKQTPLTKEQLDECITEADSHFSAQLNNQGFEPTSNALDSTQQLYKALFTGSFGYLIGKLWLSYWPRDGLSSMEPVFIPLYVSTGCFLSVVYSIFSMQVLHLFTPLQRLINRGELKKAQAIKKMLLAHKESLCQIDSI